MSASFVCAQIKQEPQYNRFQYHTYKWNTLHTEAFSIYFPYGYDSLCAFIAKEFPLAIKTIKHRMTASVSSKPNIIIYPSIDQLYESNIGMFEQEKHTLPTFIFRGNRLVLSFNGSYGDLKAQLYEAIVRSVWESRLKDDLKEQAKGPIQEKEIPSWFKEGAIRYFAHHWPVNAEDALKRTFRNNNFNSWEQVISYEPRLAGQAFCYFLTEKYYALAILNTFQQLRQKDLVRSLRLITKKPLDSLFNQCFIFYTQRFAVKNTDTTAIQYVEQMKIPRKKGVVKNFVLDDEKRFLAYTTSRNFKRTVYIYDLQSKKTKKISSYRLPPWIGDHVNNQYPLLNWEKNNLLMTLPLKGTMTIKSYNAAGSHQRSEPVTGADGVLNLQPVSNRKLLMSAFRKGQSDIVTYDLNTEKYQAIASDLYDDTYVADNFTGHHFFLSRRPYFKKDSVEQVLAQGIYAKEDSVMAIVSDTLLYTQWSRPVSVSNNEILATHTKFGTERFALVNANTGAYQTLSEYRRVQYFQQTQKITEYTIEKDSIRVTTYPFSDWFKNNQSTDTSSPWLADYRKREAAQAKEDSILKAAKYKGPSFLDDVLSPGGVKERAESREDSIDASLQYHPKKVKTYILQLHSAYFSGKVNNDYFINRYQPYQAYLGQFKFPELSGMAQGGFTDLFENHHISLAFRIPASADGSDFYVHYENTAKKLDWGLTYSRKVENLKPDQGRNWQDEKGNTYPQLAKSKTHYVDISLHYPITYDLSAGFLQALRSDRTIFLATNKYSLPFEDFKSLWSISTLSLSLNKLSPTVSFLYKGINVKLLTDVFKAFSQSEDLVLGTGIRLSYHLPVYRYITLVTQAQTGYSGGQARVLYNLGGIDNNVTTWTDTSVHFSQAAPYAFQTLVTPFRGYYQNTFYGDRYALINADLYFPLFQTLIPIETPLQFINLLQPGVFADLATAKETWNVAAIDKGWLWTFGASVRSNLAGYPIRFDVAWPGDISKKPVFYFSLSN